MLGDDKNPQNNNNSFSSPVFCMISSFARKDLALNSFRVFIDSNKVPTSQEVHRHHFESSPLLRNILPSNKKNCWLGIIADDDSSFLGLRGLWAFSFFTSNVEREGVAFNFPDASAWENSQFTDIFGKIRRHDKVGNRLFSGRKKNCFSYCFDRLATKNRSKIYW